MTLPLPLPVVGINVSKATLPICYQVNELIKHLEVSNNRTGFQQLVKPCGVHCQFIMEATGTYNLTLAY
jgi:transposase